VRPVSPAEHVRRPKVVDRGETPGLTRDELQRLLATRQTRARLYENIPLRRYGEPAEFGQAAAFVLSPAGSYITGAMIPIDGGAIRAI
jgi:NAD(P)-dependent dehydrogenase (short-subunit alcohol dehydrogenase family)